VNCAVHQFVPKLEPGAVGAHMLEAQRVLKAAGHESEIFAMEIDPRWSDRGLPLSDYGSRVPRRASDVIIYQYAIGSPLADIARTFPGVLVVNSHTQTPPELIGGWEPGARAGVALGLHQLTELGPASRLGIAVSAHNAAEMKAAGFSDVAVVPVLTRKSYFGVGTSSSRCQPESGAQWLFVGRLAPNKMQHRIVQALAWYRAAYDADAQLQLIGSGENGRYGRALRRYIRDLELDDVVSLTGSIDNASLVEAFSTADVFVCLSEHEGFCVPLLEAMQAELPIVARATSAIPETVGGAGVLLDTSRPSIVAAAVHRVIADSELRERLIVAGRARAEAFAPERVAEAFLAALEPVLA